MAYQGQFWHWDMLLTGLDWKYFNWQQMEFHGKLNLLKTGMVFADSISTVSPRYAQEIQTRPVGLRAGGRVAVSRATCFGHPQRHRRPASGIPATDPHLAAKYTPDTSRPGKPVCKAAAEGTGAAAASRTRRWSASSAGWSTKRASTWWPK